MTQVTTQSGKPARKAALEVRAGYCTDPGRVRGNNEDRFAIFDLATANVIATPAGASAAGTAKPKAHGEALVPVTPAGVLFIVADGMGGMMSGEVASQMCIEHLPTAVCAHAAEGGTREGLREALGIALRETHKKIHERAQANPEMKGMGTTCTAALLSGTGLLIGQVGDSRAYLARAGAVTQLTRDQTVWETMLGGSQRPPDEFSNAPWKNMLTQALGAQPDLSVVITEHELQPKDWLLICCDGMYRVVKPEDMAAEFANGSSPAEKAQSLVALANERGGPDNITTIVLQVM